MKKCKKRRRRTSADKRIFSELNEESDDSRHSEPVRKSRHSSSVDISEESVRRREIEREEDEIATQEVLRALAKHRNVDKVKRVSVKPEIIYNSE